MFSSSSSGSSDNGASIEDDDDTADGGTMEEYLDSLDAGTGCAEMWEATSAKQERSRLESTNYNELKQQAAAADVDVGAHPTKDELVEALLT